MQKNRNKENKSNKKEWNLKKDMKKKKKRIVRTEDEDGHLERQVKKGEGYDVDAVEWRQIR